MHYKFYISCIQGTGKMSQLSVILLLSELLNLSPMSSLCYYGSIPWSTVHVCTLVQKFIVIRTE